MLDSPRLVPAATEQAAGTDKAAQRRVLSDVLAVTVFTCIVKAMGAAKSVASARVFGLGRELDCFLVAFALASLVCETIAGSLTASLVPQIVKISLSADSTNVRTSYGSLLYSACFALLGTGLLLTVADQPAYRFIASGFSPADLVLTHGLLVAMLPMFPATAVAAIWRALLNSENRFNLVAFAPVLTPTAILFLLFAAGHELGIYALAVGVSAGALAEVGLLAIGVKRIRYSLLPRWGFRLPREWLYREYLPLLATTLVGGSRNIVDQSVAATLVPGSVSVLNLGTRVAAFVSGLGSTAIGAVLLPKLSDLAAKGNWGKLRSQVRFASTAGCTAACVIALGAIAVSRPLAYILLQKGSGQHFDVSLVAHVQTLSFTQLPFAVLSVILTRVAVAANLSRRLMIVSFAGAVLNVTLDLTFARRMGVAGIALSTTALYAISAALLLVALRTVPHRNQGFTSSSQSVGN